MTQNPPDGPTPAPAPGPVPEPSDVRAGDVVADGVGSRFAAPPPPGASGGFPGRPVDAPAAPGTPRPPESEIPTSRTERAPSAPPAETRSEAVAGATPYEPDASPTPYEPEAGPTPYEPVPPAAEVDTYEGYPSASETPPDAAVPPATPPRPAPIPASPASPRRGWTRFLPDRLAGWINRDQDDDDDDAYQAPGAEWRPSADAPAPGVSAPDPLLTYDAPGVEWTPGGELPTGEMCPVCGTEYPPEAAPDARCATCDAERPSMGMPPGLVRAGAQVLDPDATLHPRRPCAACGGEVDVDGYCTVCGTKAESERDHFREEPARWVAGVCDRGIRHHRNEDAMALAASQEPGSRGVLVVCDGVSTSVDSDVASLAGAQAARDLLWGNQPKGVGTEQSRSAAMAQALREACQAANRAVIDKTALDSTNAASATFAAAVVSDGRVFYANLGDSRVYWLPDAGEGVQLSVDDSVAQVRIDAGVPREQAENGPGAHAITKWLGRDSADTEPRVGELAPQGSGWVLACSDGLWNYASSPTDAKAVLTSALTVEPQPASLVDVAERMVRWANAQGGRDNVTVSLARIGDLDMLAPPPPEAQVPAGEVPTEPGAAETAPPVPADAPLSFEQPYWATPGTAGAELVAGTAPQGPPPRPAAAVAPAAGADPVDAPDSPDAGANGAPAKVDTPVDL